VIADWLGGISPPILWGVLALVLATAELLAPGVFLIWVAIAAGLTAATALLLPLAAPFQLLAFAIFCALSVSGGRLWYLANPADSADPKLNDLAARLVGRTVVVSEAIAGGQGRVSVDDGSWRATGPDAPPGARMAVLDVDGSTLIVGWPAA
jgi:membrane protein implicated in regulation of membrane protease activity